MQSKGKLILVVGPTGSGKGTLNTYITERFPDISYVTTCTTRARREGEPKDEYFFLTKEAFEHKVEAGELLEWALYGENYYGTPKSEVLPKLAEGKYVLLEIEVQGARRVLEMLPRDEVIAVFIDGGSWEELERRVRARAPITDEELAKRHKRYDDEITFKNQADIVIDNRDGKLEEAKAAFASFIESVRNQA